MPKIILRPLRICLWLCAFLLCAPWTLRGSESLYKRETARSLTPSEIKTFGPQAGQFRYDSRMINAARIAQSRARKHSVSRCWRYVKNALLAAGVVPSYPQTPYAKQAAWELPQNYGFRKLRITDPYQAPIGAVIVYGGPDAGHVEIRTPRGFVSDFASARPYTKRPLLGIFIKPKV